MKQIYLNAYNFNLNYPDEWNYQASAVMSDHIELQFDKQTVVVYPNGHTENLGAKPFIGIAEPEVTTEVLSPEVLVEEPDESFREEVDEALGETEEEQTSDVKMDKRRKK